EAGRCPRRRGPRRRGRGMRRRGRGARGRGASLAGLVEAAVAAGALGEAGGAGEGLAGGEGGEGVFQLEGEGLVERERPLAVGGEAVPAQAALREARELVGEGDGLGERLAGRDRAVDQAHG